MTESAPETPVVVAADTAADVEALAGTDVDDSGAATTLEALHHVTRDLVAAEDRRAVCRLAVTAARDVLELPLAGIHVDDDGELEPIAVTKPVEELYESVPAIDDPENPAMVAYREEEPIVIGEDAPPEFRSVPADAVPAEAGIIAPLPGHGVFLMTSPEDREITETEVTFALTLAANTRAALDATERERELTRQNERLETFSAMLSHDLRNPLTMLEGNLELARKTGEPEYFAKAEEAAQRMDELIDQVLVLARSGDTVEDREWIALEDVATQAWSECASGAAELVVEAPPGLRIHADPDRLRQLLANLLRNAIEHAPPEGAGSADGAAMAPGDAVGARTTDGAATEPGEAAPALTVTVGVEDDVLYVADDGQGIPPADREHVFAYGYTTADDGSGLGLRIVAELAAAHDWTPQATESEAGGARIELRGVETRDVSGEE